MTVSDEAGDTCEASKSYFVNSKPSISVQEWYPTTILGPFPVSLPISFEYLVYDQTDSADLVSVAAYSDIDGAVFQSTPNQSGDGVVTFSDLSAGFHTISLTATDPHGSTDSITTKIHINTPPTIETPYPTVAFSNTDLEFIGIPNDPDGDPVNISYVWTRNGQPTDLPQTRSQKPLSRGRHKDCNRHPKRWLCRRYLSNTLSRCTKFLRPAFSIKILATFNLQ